MHVLYADRPFPPAYLDLIEGRATIVGPDDGFDIAEAAIAGGQRWDAAEMDRFSRLRVISRLDIGVDNVDADAATARSIVIRNTPEAPTVSTAEHAVALMLAVARNLPGERERARAGTWGAAMPIAALELDGCTLGLVGFGRIARRVATVGRALGMTVIATDPFLLAPPTDTIELVDLDEVWRRSDVVSLHAPATEATRHLVNATSLAAMKPGARLINCARGALVDQDSLLAALDAGQLAGAGLDVTDPEPLPVDHPLLRHERVIVTPHIASSTAAGHRRLYAHAIDNALAVLDG
ncbi:MAG: NAD(P)-dependent oxidoreductase [Acidimicrobiales bacterium]